MVSSATPSSNVRPLPNEIIIHILRYALHVHRVTPRLADSSSYLISNLNLVSKLVRILSREIFYGENVVTVQRMLLPSQLFSTARYDCPLNLPLIRSPSPTIGPLIKRLDIFISMNYSWSLDPMHYIRDITAHEWDLGILLCDRSCDKRCINDPTCTPAILQKRRARIAWQKDMTALEDLKVVFKLKCDLTKTMENLFRILPGQVTCDLRPRRMEVEVELAHQWKKIWGCGQEMLGSCKEVVRESMEKIVREGRDDYADPRG